MHAECNDKRGGQIYGFPLFTCLCHSLQIEGRANGSHVLVMHYMSENEEFAIPVSIEKHKFVFGSRIYTGKFAHEFGGNEYIDVNIGGMWSMGNLKPGKKGITGKGQLGHVFPRISLEEVPEFNRLEEQRIKGVSPLHTIEKFNRRMDPMSIRVHFETVD